MTSVEKPLPFGERCTKWSEQDAAEAVLILEEVRDEQAAEAKLRKDTDKRCFVAFVFKLRQKARKDVAFSEDFLGHDGLEVVCSCLTFVKGNQQAELLRLVHALLTLENAIDTFTEGITLVHRVFNLLKRGSNVAKEVLEILIVTVGTKEEGPTLVHESAMKVVKDELPYAPLARLLSQSDVGLTLNVLTFLNILMTRLRGKEPAIRDLVALWKRCGLLRALQPLNELVSEAVMKQLEVFQKLTGHVVPMGWYAAQQYEQRAEELRRKQQQAMDQLTNYRSVVAKAALVKGELEHTETAVRELKEMVEYAAATKQPMRIGLSQWDEGLQQYAHTVFKDISTADEFKKQMKEVVENIVGEGARVVKKARVRKNDENDDLFETDSDESSSESDAGGRGPAWAPPPPSDPSESSSSRSSSYDSSSDGEPPSDDDDDSYPPPDDDDYAGVDYYATGTAVAADGSAAAAGTVIGPDGTPVPAAPGTAAAGAAAGGGAGGAPGVPGAGAVAGAGGAAPVAGGAPGVAPPPPGKGAKGAPAAPGGKAAPPPPPAAGGKGGKGDKGGKGGKKGPVVKELKLEFYVGPLPSQKMRVMHWEKYALYEGVNTMWNRVHSSLGGDLDCKFDTSEFETMFSQKVGKEKKEKEDKPEVIMLMQVKDFQNISIMMHKMPTVPDIQRAVQQLDSSSISRDQIEALLGAAPNEEQEKEFKMNADKKAPELYEAPEQFFAMVINSIAFVKRCKSWMLTFDWDEIVVSSLKPIGKVKNACDSILASPSLPYVMGLILGFGNYMNEGHAKGNAPGFGVTTLSKLEMTKDVSGKVNLLQYVVQVVKDRNIEALKLAEELKPCMQGVQGTKMSDLDDGIKNTSNALKTFKKNVRQVKDELEAAGVSEEDDPFVRKMTEFYKKAEVESENVETRLKEAKEAYEQVLIYMASKYNPSKLPDPDEFFSHLCPFLEKFSAEASSILKEMKKKEQVGRKITKNTGKEDAGLEDMVKGFAEDLVQS